MNLLKTHEEILERLTEIASKETKFEERSQFMNVQKMIKEELTIIEKLKESETLDNSSNQDKVIKNDYRSSVYAMMKQCFIGAENDEKPYPNFCSDSTEIISIDISNENSGFNIVYSVGCFDLNTNRRVIKYTNKIKNISNFEVSDIIFKMAKNDTKICLNYRGFESMFVDKLISSGLGLVEDYRLHSVSTTKFQELKSIEVDGCNKCIILNIETSDSDKYKNISLEKNIKDMNLLVYNIKEEDLEEFKHIKRAFPRWVEDGSYNKSTFLTIREFNNFCDRLIDLKQDDIDVYKLGVGKLLIGQRASGVSSTLIDECIKYNRPLLFKTQKQADLFKTRNPSLRAYCYDTEEETEYYNEEVCVELLLYDCDSKLISEELDKIKHKVKSICTVGISYHNKNKESEHFIHGVNMYK